ncbi:hypothetical protein KC887_00890 [Candidatus Kaiserbacteria bacterium]|nr:hypothetical protein [Candidatus Kaiserbacteria bacterium]
MAIKYKQQTGGFALLITLIVVGVVLSVGLSILDLSIKQINLSTASRDSELAFHASSAGVECARYWRRAASSTMEAMAPVNFECFGLTNSNVSPTIVSSGISGVGDVLHYDYQFTWGANNDRCTEVTTFLMFGTLPPNPGVTITNTELRNIIPGYPAGPDKSCEAGAECTVISVRGYNKSCANSTDYGVTEREVLLEF